MLTSLSLIFLVGLAMGAICQEDQTAAYHWYAGNRYYFRPLCAGSVRSFYSGDFRGTQKDGTDHYFIESRAFTGSAGSEKAGRSAIMLSFVPASCEIVGYILLAPVLLGVNHIEAAVMGAVLAAVSPAVVVPRMVSLMERKYGTERAIPQMIMAGASCDDIFVIVLFTTFLSMAQGGTANVLDFVNIPVSIVLGILLGGIFGFLLCLFFETAYAKKTLHQKQYESDHRTGSFFPADRDRRLAGRNGCSFRSAGGGQYGVCDQAEKYGVCFKAVV